MKTVIKNITKPYNNILKLGLKIVEHNKYQKKSKLIFVYNKIKLMDFVF